MKSASWSNTIFVHRVKSCLKVSFVKTYYSLKYISIYLIILTIGSSIKREITETRMIQFGVRNTRMNAHRITDRRREREVKVDRELRSSHFLIRDISFRESLINIVC
jgi:hypothetical protein